MTSEFASADDLFGQPFKRRYTTCTLPVKGVKCKFRSLSEEEYEHYQSSQLDKRGAFSKDKMLSAQRDLISWTLCDGDGNRLTNDPNLFKTFDRADVKAMYDTAMAITGSTDEDIKDLAGNDGSVSDDDPEDS